MFGYYLMITKFVVSQRNWFIYFITSLTTQTRNKQTINIINKFMPIN